MDADTAQQWFSSLPPEIVASLLESLSDDKFNQVISRLPESRRAVIVEKTIINGDSYSYSANNSFFTINGEMGLSEIVSKGADYIAEKAAEVMVRKLEILMKPRNTSGDI